MAAWRRLWGRTGAVVQRVGHRRGGGEALAGTIVHEAHTEERTQVHIAWDVHPLLMHVLGVQAVAHAQALGIGQMLEACKLSVDVHGRSMFSASVMVQVKGLSILAVGSVLGQMTRFGDASRLHESVQAFPFHSFGASGNISYLRAKNKQHREGQGANHKKKSMIHSCAPQPGDGRQRGALHCGGCAGSLRRAHGCGREAFGDGSLWAAELRLRQRHLGKPRPLPDPPSSTVPPSARSHCRNMFGIGRVACEAGEAGL